MREAKVDEAEEMIGIAEKDEDKAAVMLNVKAATQ